jgi:hypothetical protein
MGKKALKEKSDSSDSSDTEQGEKAKAAGILKETEKKGKKQSSSV